MKPRLFISTVSSELGTTRQLTANVLQRLGYDPVWQDIFGTEPGELLAMLRAKIDGCEGLIHIVGRGYGAEPTAPDPEFGRLSYTQYEFLYARRRGLKTWVFFADDGCTHDRPLEQLDLPSDPAYPDPIAYQAERRALQDAWRTRLRQEGHLRHEPANDTELELKLERLRDDFIALRRGFRRWQGWVAGLGAAAVLLLACVLLGQWWIKRGTDVRIDDVRKQVARVQEAQVVTKTRIRVHLIEASERARDAELAEADKEPQFDERERRKELATKAHEARLRRIDDLAASFVELERRADSSPVLREMTRILNEEKDRPVDKAITYVERQRLALLERVRERRRAEQERNRNELMPLLKEAGLEQARGHAATARARYAELLELEPNWPQALEHFAWFLFDQAVDTEYHGTLRAALADAQQSADLAERLYNQDKARPEGQRGLAAASLQLGDILAQRGQNGDADQALQRYSRAVEILETLLKQNPDSAQAARDVAVSLSKLGGFFAQRRQPGDAEKTLQHYTRSLEIRETLLRQNPDSAQAARDVAVALNTLSDVLARRGQSGDAEMALQHYTRSLELVETLRRHDPSSAQAARDVSVTLEKLGDFLALRGHPGDAEKALQYYTRDLEISETLLTQNPSSAQAARDVFLSLNKLGDFLAERAQPDDVRKALAHYTRGLELAETVLKQNPDSAHAARDVAFSLNTLGDFLAQRAQSGDAEKAFQHYTHSLELVETLLRQNPDSAQAARDVAVALEKLGDFLTQRGRPGDAEKALEYYTRDLEISETLLKQNPDSAQAARDVAVGLNKLGGSLAQRGQSGDAEKALQHYTHSLEIRATLLKQNPNSAEAARELMVSHYKLGELAVRYSKYEEAVTHFQAGIAVLDGMIARRLNEAAAAQEKSALEVRLRFCRLALLATGDWDALLKTDAKALPVLLSFRATELAKGGRLADVAQAGAKLRELEPKTNETLYKAARAYAVGANLAVRNKAMPTDAERAERERFIGLSLDCLKEAIAAGYNNFARMKQDSELSPLRDRPEFQQLFPKPTARRAD